jgi:hypothetical protein
MDREYSIDVRNENVINFRPKFWHEENALEINVRMDFKGTRCDDVI